MSDNFVMNLFQTPQGNKRGCLPTMSEEKEIMEAQATAVLTSYKYTKYKPFPCQVGTPEVLLHPIEVEARAFEAGMVAVAKTFSPFGQWSSGESPKLKAQKTVSKAAYNNFVKDHSLLVKEKVTTWKEGVVLLGKKRELEDVLVNMESEKQTKKIRAMESIGSVESQKLLCDDCQDEENCEWHGEVGEEMKNYAEMLENEEDNNKQIRFHLYQYYSRAKHGPSMKGLRVPLPWCVELQIKREYPNGGKTAYTFFKQAKAAESDN